MQQTLVYTILEILKYILPALVVMGACYMIINKFLVADYQRKQLAVFQDHVKVTMPMRMQAYERLILFVERMSTMQLISRFYVNGATALDLQQAMTQNIRTEFEYNMSQQLYVSNEVWQTIVAAKEQEISMINSAFASLPNGASAKQLADKLHDILAEENDDTPVQIAIMSLNGEAKRVLEKG